MGARRSEAGAWDTQQTKARAGTGVLWVPILAVYTFLSKRWIMGYRSDAWPSGDLGHLLPLKPLPSSLSVMSGLLPGWASPVPHGGPGGRRDSLIFKTERRGEEGAAEFISASSTSNKALGIMPGAAHTSWFKHHKHVYSADVTTSHMKSGRLREKEWMISKSLSFWETSSWGSLMPALCPVLLMSSPISGYWSLKETRFLPGAFYVGQIPLPGALGLAQSEPGQPRPKLRNLLATWVDSALIGGRTMARGPNPACQLRLGFTFFFYVAGGKKKTNILW